MRRILCKDPTNRIKMEDILEDAWVTNDGKERLDPNEVQYFKKGDLGNVDRLVKMNQMGLSTTNINHKQLGINIDSIKKNEAIKLGINLDSIKKTKATTELLQTPEQVESISSHSDDEDNYLRAFNQKLKEKTNVKSTFTRSHEIHIDEAKDM